jgi:hypothetical protein
MSYSEPVADRTYAPLIETLSASMKQAMADHHAPGNSARNRAIARLKRFGRHFGFVPGGSDCAPA